jgi:ABC-type glutathione transport system ATPase component
MAEPTLQHPPLLALQGVSVEFPGARRVVDGVSLSMQKGEIHGIAGESGSGKTQLLLALLGLPPAGARLGGSALLNGEQLIDAPEARLRALRGNRLSIVFQDPMTALNPQLKLGLQMTEVLQVHGRCGTREARERAATMLEAVGLTDPLRRLRQYPHELSGGMRQRVMIAMALLCEPDLLLADEPTTALDVTVQAQILDLLLDLRERLHMGILFVTHDLGVLAQVADAITVMRGGRVVEQSDAVALFDSPREPYTRQLLDAARRLELGAGQAP